MNRKRFLFTTGERLRGLRGLLGLSRPEFARTVGMSAKRLENIESGRQRMHDEDLQKVCSTFEAFSRWLVYEGPVERRLPGLKITDSAHRATLYLIKCNPQLLEGSGLSFEDWQMRHRDALRELGERIERGGDGESARDGTD